MFECNCPLTADTEIVGVSRGLTLRLNCELKDTNRVSDDVCLISNTNKVFLH